MPSGTLVSPDETLGPTDPSKFWDLWNPFYLMDEGLQKTAIAMALIEFTVVVLVLFLLGSFIADRLHKPARSRRTHH